MSEIIDYTLAKREGTIHALNEVKEMTGSMPLTKELPVFTVDGEKIEPKINVYSSEGEEIKNTLIDWAKKKM
jgi:hypothetical protein